MAIDLFSIGKFTVHGYGLMIGLGFMAAVLVGSALAKKRDLSDNDFVNIAIFVLIIGFLGGKILHVIVEFKAFLADPMSVIGSEGFVVYGGIITGIATIFVYCRVKKLEFLKYLDLFATVVPLNQAFGRIGCLCAGCCYGIEYNGFGHLEFPEGCIAPAHIGLWPTQPVMAAGNFVIFLVQLIRYIKGGSRLRTGTPTALYLMLYSAGRFAVEFARDDERGAVGVLSTSQFIALFTFAAGLILFVLTCKRFQKTEGADN